MLLKASVVLMVIAVSQDFSPLYLPSIICLGSPLLKNSDCNGLHVQHWVASVSESLNFVSVGSRSEMA